MDNDYRWIIKDIVDLEDQGDLLKYRGQKSLIAAQNKQSLDYLLIVEQNVCRTRDSGIDECHYNSSCNSLASLLTRKENLIAMKHMIGLQKYPKSGRDPIEGHRVFSNRPKPMTDGMLITIDTARAMPFFDKLDLSDKVTNLVDQNPDYFWLQLFASSKVIAPRCTNIVLFGLYL
ncbi:unnamed protein product [Meloidogyne enterolobii]|uniref:Uncharacterized protein n=1 Tax=Meloidogyne enterolobii TaxID=390850 RepID=A0ACB0YVR1_MELEN